MANDDSTHFDIPADMSAEKSVEHDQAKELSKRVTPGQVTQH